MARRGGKVYWRTRIRVYERCGYACVQCGKQFDRPTGDDYRGHAPSLSKYDEWGRWRMCLLEIDHIVPHRHGGHSNEANLQALCTQCNIRKGASV